MSNKCPHCGAAAGKFHEPCPYAPGGKKSKAPRPEPGRSDAEEVKAVSVKALARKPVHAAAPQAEIASPAFEEAIQPGDAASPSHPDCKRCAQVREQTRDRVRRAREKKAEGKKS